MRRVKFKSLLFYTVFTFLTLVLLLFLTFPKFLFLDRELLRKNLYLTADKVEEGLTGLYLTNASLYDQHSRLLRFDRLNLSIGLTGVKLLGFCEGGRFQGQWSFGPPD
ncbi:MAG: hypothetical protein N2648_05800 [Aquificaceae bacterium]|nr:hypothetical protein [Aquificaceae bacterium]